MKKGDVKEVKRTIACLNDFSIKIGVGCFKFSSENHARECACSWHVRAGKDPKPVAN